MGVGELLHNLRLLEERLGGHRVRLERLHGHLHLALPGALVDLAEVARPQLPRQGDLGLRDLVLVPGGVLQGVAPPLLGRRLGAGLGQLAAQALGGRWRW